MFVSNTSCFPSLLLSTISLQKRIRIPPAPPRQRVGVSRSATIVKLSSQGARNPRSGRRFRVRCGAGGADGSVDDGWWRWWWSRRRLLGWVGRAQPLGRAHSRRPSLGRGGHRLWIALIVHAQSLALAPPCFDEEAVAYGGWWEGGAAQRVAAGGWRGRWRRRRRLCGRVVNMLKQDGPGGERVERRGEE